MNTAIILKNAKTFGKKVAFKFRKSSPEIMLIGGVVGCIGTTVMACIATTKVSTVIDTAKDEKNKINGVLDGSISTSSEYTEEDGKKDMLIVYAHAGWGIVKVYGPSLILGTLSVGSILASHNVLKKRNVALAAAYAGVSKSFKDYRGQVIERYGENVDRELKYGIKAEQIATTVVDEDGKKHKVKETIETIDPNNPNLCSPYAKFFDESCPDWKKDAEFNRMFLQTQENYANDKLKLNHYLFLNEVYDMLGMERTKAGQVVGWVYDEDHPIGDNYVDFGIYGVNAFGDDERKRAFVNGTEQSILLDFNVDGNVWELMK